jgi:hypothetical protein
MKSASQTMGRVEKPLTVRSTLSRAAVQFVEKHPNEVTAIVANALEAAALEAGLAAPERVLPGALRRLVVARLARDTPRSSNSCGADRGRRQGGSGD